MNLKILNPDEIFAFEFSLEIMIHESLYFMTNNLTKDKSAKKVDRKK